MDEHHGRWGMSGQGIDGGARRCLADLVVTEFADELSSNRPSPGGGAASYGVPLANPDLAAHLREADIVIVAIGRPGLVTGDMLKRGVVVVDVGINVVDGRLVGDVNFDSAARVASAITPVPGGVGP